MRDNTRDLDTLLARIVRTSNDILNITSTSPATTQQTIPPRSFNVTLPEPPSLLSKFTDIGVPLEVGMQMDRIFHQRLSTFRAHCESMADAACYETATSGSRLADIEEKIVAAITSIYLKKVSALVDECTALAQSRVSTRKLAGDQAKSSGFNYVRLAPMNAYLFFTTITGIYTFTGTLLRRKPIPIARR